MKELMNLLRNQEYKKYQERYHILTERLTAEELNQFNTRIIRSSLLDDPTHPMLNWILDNKQISSSGVIHVESLLRDQDLITIAKLTSITELDWSLSPLSISNSTASSMHIPTDGVSIDRIEQPKLSILPEKSQKFIYAIFGPDSEMVKDIKKALNEEQKTTFQNYRNAFERLLSENSSKVTNSEIIQYVASAIINEPGHKHNINENYDEQANKIITEALLGHKYTVKDQSFGMQPHFAESIKNSSTTKER